MTERILQIIYQVIDTLNEELGPDRQISKMPDTQLTGKFSNLDSVSVLNFLVALEDRVNEEWNANITLMDETVMSQENNPLVSIQTLGDYVASILGGAH